MNQKYHLTITLNQSMTTSREFDIISRTVRTCSPFSPENRAYRMTKEVKIKRERSDRFDWNYYRSDHYLRTARRDEIMMKIMQ